MPQVRKPLRFTEDEDAATQIAAAKRHNADESEIKEALRPEVSAQRCPKSS
jgi:hypothetical protein